MSNPKFNNHSTFIPRKFPTSFSQSTEQEANELWSIIEAELLNSCFPGNIDSNRLHNLLPRLEVYISNYKPSVPKKDFIASVLLNVLVSENVTNRLKLMLMGVIYPCLTQNSSLKANWKASQEFLDSLMESNNNKKAYAKGLGYLEKVRPRIGRLLQQIKFLYNEESVEEVVREMKQ